MPAPKQHPAPSSDTGDLQLRIRKPFIGIRAEGRLEASYLLSSIFTTIQHRHAGRAASKMFSEVMWSRFVSNCINPGKKDPKPYTLYPILLGRIRGTLKREPRLNPLLALFNRDLSQRVYIPKGPLILFQAAPTKFARTAPILAIPWRRIRQPVAV